jgi:MoxR-like ATPase
MTNRPSKTIRAIRPGHVLRLDETDHLGASHHQWDQREIDALTLALAANRPLLVRGEPGTGKTQLARAAAQHLGWELESVTIHARFEPQDLQWRFDAIKRLADASSPATTAEMLDGRRAEYWEPGPLWKAYDWATATDYGSCRTRKDAEEPPPAPAGFVVLIDEIDKADADLPNALLEVLGARCFSIPALNLKIGGPNRPQPLVIITTNEERELPPAFQRRCVVLNLDAGSRDYQAWLIERGKAHFGALTDEAHGVNRPALIEDNVLQLAARQLMVDRDAARDAGLPRPGAAEYLDLLHAVHELEPRKPEAQLDWLRKLSAYAYVKNAAVEGVPALDQGRPSVPDSTQ